MNKQHIFAQAVLRSWPFRRGIGRIMNGAFPRLRFDEQVTTVRTTDGFNLRVFPNELIGRHIYLTGEYERSIVEVLCKFATVGDTLFDVGANIGYISSCFLQNVANSRVICVEPQPGVLDLLRSNLDQFSRDRYEIFPIALSDKNGLSQFTINSENRGDGRVVSHVTEGDSITVEVKAARDLFVSFAQKPNLIKIDVQGHEEQILQSLKGQIEKFRPRAVLFEDEGTKSAPNQAIGKIFSDIGYDVFGLQKRLFGIDLVAIRGVEDCKRNDYLAVGKGCKLPPAAISAWKILSGR